MNPSDIQQTQRRGFLKALGGLTAGLAALPSIVSAQNAPNAPARAAGAKYMGDFAAPKLEKVKVAIIGVGARGSGHATQLASIDGVQFVGICDLNEGRAKKSEEKVKAKGHTPKVYFGEEEAWKKMLAETKPEDRKSVV